MSKAEKISNYESELVEKSNTVMQSKHAERFKRMQERRNKRGVAPNFNTYVVNEVEDTTLVKSDKIEVVSVSGPTEVKAGELATYTITGYKGEPTEKDKKSIYWSVYIDGKKINRIRLQNDKENADSASDIYSGNKKKKAFILYVKKTSQEDKIEIKFSKWLDARKIKVEAHKGMSSFDSSCQVETKIIAKPEILSIHWVNAKEERIKFSGYDQDVFLSVITLGLKGKKLTLDIFDYDSYKDDDPLDWGENSIAIKQRKTVKQFPIKKREDYGLQEKDDLTPSLELYVVAKSSEPLENPKEKYAYYLNLTPNELIFYGYFAEEEKIEVQKGEEKKPEPQKLPPTKPTNYTVVKGDDLAKIAKKKDVPYTQIMDANPDTKWELLIPNKTILVIPVKKEAAKAKEKDTKTITYYQKIDTASLGSEVHLVAETTNLEGKKVTFKVFEKEPILLTSKDKPLPLLVGKTEKTEIEATVSDGKAQIKVVINRKAEKAQKDWEKKLSPTEEIIEGWYYDSVNDQSIKMANPFDVRFVLEPKRYTPATQTIEAKKTYLWLQVICKGAQRNFDIPFLKGNSFEVIHGDRAPWMKIAYGELGVEEIKGKEHNSKILDYHKSAGVIDHKNKKGLSVKITDDKNWPWCSSFVCWVFSKTDNYSGKITAKATNWKNWGKSESKDKPMYGALAVIDWGKNDNKAGHVGFIVKADKDYYYLLGGNQTGGDENTKGKVCIGRYRKSDIDYIRIPSNYKTSNKDYIYDKIKISNNGFESLGTTR